MAKITLSIGYAHDGSGNNIYNAVTSQNAMNTEIYAWMLAPTCDTISELTTATGVTIDGVLLKDNSIAVTGAVTNLVKFTGTVGTATDGTLFSTGSTWVSHATAGQCAFKILAANAASSGDYATMRIRGRADVVSSGGTEGLNVSASANIANYGDLCAGYFAAQPNAINNNSASNIITALHAVVDRTGTASGRTWVAWVDTHAQTKSGAGDYLMRMSHNGTVANDGCWTIYNGGRMPVLFNFEDATASGFLTETGDAGSTKAGYLAVTTPAGTKYIQLVTT